MQVIEVGPQTNELRRKFFTDIFGENRGIVAVAVKGKKHGKFSERYFAYPDDLNKLLEWINRHFHSNNLYFCPQLLGAKKRAKESVLSCPVIWSDLDECDPEILDPPPTIVVRTSPGRHHAYWVLREPVGPTEGEDASHRLAYKYEAFGADKSGWDLSQLLRIPGTYNTKYEPEGGVYPIIEVTKKTKKKYTLADFEKLDPVPGFIYEEVPFPKQLLKKKPDAVIEKYKNVLDPRVIELYREEPTDDWSSALWHLEMLLLEHDLPVEDVFVICHNAKCNKFARDNRPPEALWRDICKADTRVHGHLETAETNPIPDLLTEAERKKIRGYKTFVEKYVEWASGLGDAASQYHEAGAITILSSLLSGVIRLKTSFGVIVPNLWFMILADTTLTRKSTAMSSAMNMLREVEKDSILATDGSLEGLITAMSTRPGRPGVFWRDEFSGLLEMMRRKDYYAGMAETLTKLYDGEYQKRILRKEIIELKDPILLVFCGGIRTRIFELLDTENVISGFLPRFIFVEAESDIEGYRPIGPLSEEQDDVRTDLVAELAEMFDTYHSDMTLRIAGQVVAAPAMWDVDLTSAAWDRYNEFEQTMVRFGHESISRDTYTPMMDRLSKSTLKVAVLLAASRQDPSKKGRVIVDVPDILKAITYCERWRDYAIDVLENAGKTATEKKVESVLRLINSNPDGVTRSKLMQNAKLTAREADWILETLSQRGQIKRTRYGRTEQLHATGPRKKKPA